MDSNTWNWRERLKGKVICQCGRAIELAQGIPNTWVHSFALFNADCPTATPRLHAWSAEQAEQMGYEHGMNGASLLDNPFAPHGPLYDGADSMGEGAVWYQGWRRAQLVLGTTTDKTVKPDGFDYLEAERG